MALVEGVRGLVLAVVRQLPAGGTVAGHCVCVRSATISILTTVGMGMHLDLSQLILMRY